MTSGRPGLASGPFLNPFGPQSAAGPSYITSTKIIGEVQAIDGNIWRIRGHTSGGAYEPAGRSAGPWRLGAEYRKEEVDYINNFTLIRQAASSGLELAEDTQGDRDVWAVLAEITIPIVKNLE